MVRRFPVQKRERTIAVAGDHTVRAGVITNVVDIGRELYHAQKLKVPGVKIETTEQAEKNEDTQLVPSKDLDVEKRIGGLTLGLTPTRQAEA
jgi:hypothetical protein